MTGQRLRRADRRANSVSAPDGWRATLIQEGHDMNATAAQRELAYRAFAEHDFGDDTVLAANGWHTSSAPSSASTARPCGSSSARGRVIGRAGATGPQFLWRPCTTDPESSWAQTIGC